MAEASVPPPRRQVVAGALWVVPTVIAAAAAPAAAASACPPGCPSASFGGALSTNGWSWTTSGSFAQGANQRLGYSAAYTPWNGTDACTGATGGTAAGTLTNAVVGEADPTSGSPVPSLTYERTICLVSGVSYTFSFAWNYYGINRRAAYLDTFLLNPSLAQVAQAARITAPAASANARGSRTFSYTALATGTYTYRYHWTFAATPTWASTGCNSYANDIAVQAPTITCSPNP